MTTDPTHPVVKPWYRPLTLWLGLLIIAATEIMLLLDVQLSGRGVVPHEIARADLNDPTTALGWVARWFALNVTPFCWVGYLLLMEGLLTRLAWRRGRRGSAIRQRPWLFAVAWLTSVPVWCFFDWVNFYWLDAWRYYGLPPYWWQRYPGYLISFAAISPAMFLAAQLYQQLGLRRLRTRGQGLGRAWQVGAFVFGIVAVILPFFMQDPRGVLLLWVSIVFLLDPINWWCGRPSILRDWSEGRWGRTVSLMLGGATCGFCWEFWNYWALTKWTYHLPFLGALEHYRYFEMPWVGFVGFLPFAIECWVALQTICLLLPGVSEPLPGEDDVL
jgi:hypothetical protein